jgi:seryl-tRNA synthetase
MAEERTLRIEQFLEKNNLSRETITKKQYHILEMVDDSIQNRLDIISKCDAECRKANINISSIAKEIHVSNKTFYNSPFLAKYVNEAAEKTISKHDSSEAYKQLKQQYDNLQSQLQKMLLRDIDIENAKVEIEALQNELKHIQAAYASLQEQYEKLLKESMSTPDISRMS